MAVTLVTTAGAADANSYADVAQLRAHADLDPFGPAVLETAGDADTMARALARATRRIDMEGFAGRRVEATQALAFPRAWLTDPDGFAVPVDAIAPWLVQATCEQAMAYLRHGETDPAAPSGLEAFAEFTVGDLTLKPRSAGEDPAPATLDVLCPPALRLLAPYLATSAGVVRLRRA